MLNVRHFFMASVQFQIPHYPDTKGQILGSKLPRFTWNIVKIIQLERIKLKHSESIRICWETVSFLNSLNVKQFNEKWGKPRSSTFESALISRVELTDSLTTSLDSLENGRVQACGVGLRACLQQAYWSYLLKTSPDVQSEYKKSLLTDEKKIGKVAKKFGHQQFFFCLSRYCQHQRFNQLNFIKDNVLGSMGLDNNILILDEPMIAVWRTYLCILLKSLSCVLQTLTDIDQKKLSQLTQKLDAQLQIEQKTLSEWMTKYGFLLPLPILESVPHIQK